MQAAHVTQSVRNNRQSLFVKFESPEASTCLFSPQSIYTRMHGESRLCLVNKSKVHQNLECFDLSSGFCRIEGGSAA
eukprot:3878701-Amphidinium_carterae.1